MATSSFEPLLYFGVEMEMLIRPRSSLMAILSSEYNWESGVTPATPDSNRRARNRRALHQAVAEILTSGGVPATTSAGDYRDWTVADDGSIDESVEFCMCHTSESPGASPHFTGYRLAYPKLPSANIVSRQGESKWCPRL